MTDELEELFGEAGGQPQPRRGLVLGLLGSGLLLSTFGMACSAAPGGLIVLGAWMVVDKEMERVESGYLPEDSRTEVRRLQQATMSGLAIVLALFFVQSWLFYSGFYETLFVAALRQLLTLVGS